MVIRQSHDDILRLFAESDPILLLSGLSILVGANIFAGIFFRSHTQEKNSKQGKQKRVEPSPIFVVFMLSQIAKYVPGKVWSVIAQKAYLGPDVSTVNLLVSNVKLTILALVVIIASSGIFMTAYLSQDPKIWLPLSVFAFVSIFFLGKLDFTRLLSRFIEYGYPLKINRTQESIAGISGSLYFLLFTVGWYLVFLSATPVDHQQALRYSLAFCIGQSAGIVSMMPAGLGARELAVLGSTTAFGIEEETGVYIALFSRLVLLGIDALCFLIGVVLTSLKKK